MADAFEAVQMSDDVAAVMADTLMLRMALRPHSPQAAVGEQLAALTAAGYAVVAVPEGVAVAHGARLVAAPTVSWGTYKLRDPLYAIEATP